MKPFNHQKKIQSHEVENDFHIIERLAVLGDYLKNRPKMIKYIVARAQHLESVKKLVGALPIRIYGPEEWQKHHDALMLPSQTAVWAAVKVEVFSEQDLDVRLKKKKDRDVLIALDHITDPRNLGAIVRSAAYFGLQEIIVPRDRQVLLTSSSIKTAQGGFAVTDLMVVTNLVRTLRKLKQQGYWIIGTAKEGKSLKQGLSLDFDKVVLVLGSEDKGISPLVEKNCDLTVCIEGVENSIDSLNVSVAAGIMLNYLNTRP